MILYNAHTYVHTSKKIISVDDEHLGPVVSTHYIVPSSNIQNNFIKERERERERERGGGGKKAAGGGGS